MKVLGTNLYDSGFESAINDLIAISTEPPMNKCISASDAHVLVLAKTQTDFSLILRAFYWNLPDGVPTVWILKWKGAKQASRISGPAFFEGVMKATQNMPINHFLCGGVEGVAEDLKQVCESWGNFNVVGVSSPPFKNLDIADYQNIGKLITHAKTNIVWVGMGAPKQIYFASELIKYINVQAIVTIGAAFDFHTKRIKKAPVWIQKIGMEWLFRLIQEPKRLFKRYLKTIPQFIYFGILDVIKKQA